MLTQTFMKHFLFLLFFTYTCTSFSQIESKSFSDKYEEFDFYAKPDKTNDLSKYFKHHIDSRLLNTYKVSDTVEDNKHVYLTFKLNTQNKVTSVIVNSPYFELNKSIKEAFLNYDIEKLYIPIKNRLNTYLLQILSIESDKMIINCSTNIVYDQFPVFESCQSMTNYYQAKSCFDKLLEAHVAKYFSPDVIKKAKVLGSLTLRPEFIINEKGDIELLPKATNDSLTKELNRVVALFPKANIPPLRNGKPTRINHKGNIRLEIDTENKEYINDVIKSNDSIVNPNNELALHFKNNIGEQELSEINFPLPQKSISLTFSIDQKGQYTDVKTNCKNPRIGSKLVEIFKKFPLEKLNIKFNNILESFQYTIITKGYDKKAIIECSDKPIVIIPPFFDKNCQKSESPNELMNCFWENIHSTIRRNFDTTLLSKTELQGKYRISCSFEIDTDAKIKNVKVKAPNPIIANETEKIINKISSVYKPAYSNGIAIKKNFRITIPIVLEKKYDDPFRMGLKDF